MKKKTRQDFQELLKTEHGKKGCTSELAEFDYGVGVECGKVSDDRNSLRIIQTSGKVSKWAGNKKSFNKQVQVFIDKCIRKSLGNSRGLLVVDMNIHVVLHAVSSVLLTEKLVHL